ncbi:MAG: hypothetical protein SGCHY_000469 [Lobulomycetales sp.]
MDGPRTHTQQPAVTGTSVLGIKYKDGVMLAADTLASYGRLSKYRDTTRLVGVGQHTVVGAGGDISDFQHIQHVLTSLTTQEYDFDDGHSLGPKNVHGYLARLLYARRSKFNPLWNSLIVGGVKNGESFLGYVDLQGTTYMSPCIATGFGAHLAIPLMRTACEGGRDAQLSAQDAKKVLEECMRVLFYRDCSSFNKIQIATVDASGISITEPYSLSTEWSFAENIRGYGAVYGE